MSQTISHLFQEELYNVPPRTVIIVAQPWHTILEDEKALLAKILGSVRVSIASVTILSQSSVSFETLSVYNAGKVLIFGSAVPSDIKPYENVKLNGVSVIRADELGQLDDARKKNLWQALRQMFGV